MLTPDRVHLLVHLTWFTAGAGGGLIAGLVFGIKLGVSIRGEMIARRERRRAAARRLSVEQRRRKVQADRAFRERLRRAHDEEFAEGPGQ